MEGCFISLGCTTRGEDSGLRVSALAQSCTRAGSLSRVMHLRLPPTVAACPIMFALQYSSNNHRWYTMSLFYLYIISILMFLLINLKMLKYFRWWILMTVNVGNNRKMIIGNVYVSILKIFLYFFKRKLTVTLYLLG